MNETITAEYIQAITGTNRRQEVLTIIAEYCRTVSADERTIIENFFDSENQIDFRRNLFQCGISLKMNEAKNLLQIILRPIAAELGIRITGEPTGDAAAIIAEARKRYAEQQATLARRAASNPNETRGRPPEVEKVLPKPGFAVDPGGSSNEMRHTFFSEARADAAPEPVSKNNCPEGQKQ